MDITKEFLSLKEVADFLGLKYHHTRNLLLADVKYGHTVFNFSENLCYFFCFLMLINIKQG